MCEEKIHLFERAAIFGFTCASADPTCGRWRMIFFSKLNWSLPRTASPSQRRTAGRLRHSGVRILRRGLIGLELLRDPAAEGWRPKRPESWTLQNQPANDPRIKEPKPNAAQSRAFPTCGLST
jgi:hypothetical protein